MQTVADERLAVNGRELLAEVMEAGYAALQGCIAQQLLVVLTAAVLKLLGRDYHVRRTAVGCTVETTAYCQRCKSHQAQRFSRNGHRARWLLTAWGSFHIQLPRAVCECKGSVHLPFEGLVRKYQRTTEAVDATIQRWYGLGLSLRQLQQELAHSYIDPFGLATLLARLKQLPTLTGAGRAVPPILQVDAIWITPLRPTGRTRCDQRGRQRAVKGRVKRPILLALGVWPAEERCELLACELADTEDEAAWLQFLSRLEEQGIRGEQGLELIIHDGGGGLSAALQMVHFEARYQRCLFHKLRNLRQALAFPADLAPAAKRKQARTLLKAFRHIWQAKRLTTALRRYLRVVRRYRSRQPAAIATLRRAFRATLSYYHLEAAHPT
jgi:transposase-like protein